MYTFQLCTITNSQVFKQMIFNQPFPEALHPLPRSIPLERQTINNEDDCLFVYISNTSRTSH